MELSYQHELRLLGEVRRPAQVAESIIADLPTFRSALRYAVNHSGLVQCEIALACGIDPGEFSRMLRDPRAGRGRAREFPSEKLATFCRVTNSKAPVQWMAQQVGDQLVPWRQETAEQRIARLEAENAALKLRVA